MRVVQLRDLARARLGRVSGGGERADPELVARQRVPVPRVGDHQELVPVLRGEAVVGAPPREVYADVPVGCLRERLGSEPGEVQVAHVRETRRQPREAAREGLEEDGLLVRG